MKTYNLNEETVNSYLKETIKTFPSNSWVGDNTIIFKDTDRTELGKINIKEDSEGSETVLMEITGAKIIKFIDELEFRAKKNCVPLTSDKLKKMVFKNCLNKNKSCMKTLSLNTSLLLKIDKKLSEIGIKNIVFDKDLNLNTSLNKVPTIYFNSQFNGDTSGNHSNGSSIKEFLRNTYREFLPSDGNIICSTIFSIPALLHAEPVTPILLKDNEAVGMYYPKRNFVHMYYNPLSLKQVSPLETEVNQIMLDFIEAIKKANVKPVNTTKIQNEIFVSSFLESSQHRLKTIKNELKSQEKNIDTYEKTIGECIVMFNNLDIEQKFIINNLKLKGKGLMNEIEEAKKLPFITKLDLTTNKIVITFKPAILKVPNFYINSHEPIGLRYFYIGPIEFSISPESFIVKNREISIGNYPHPHGSGSNKPCFGDGDARRSIFNALASNKISDLATLLWFWIKTYRDSGAYIHFESAYDELLSHGIPIWDEKGKRIEINDPKKLKTGEQRTLRKQPGYDANIKKYKDVELEK